MDVWSEARGLAELARLAVSALSSSSHQNSSVVCLGCAGSLALASAESFYDIPISTRPTTGSARSRLGRSLCPPLSACPHPACTRQQAGFPPSSSWTFPGPCPSPFPCSPSEKVVRHATMATVSTNRCACAGAVSGLRSRLLDVVFVDAANDEPNALDLLGGLARLGRTSFTVVR